MSQLLVHWFVVTIALATAVWLLPGVQVDSLQALLIGSLVLGLVNASVRPVMVWATFPLTLVTLGLFYFVVNAGAFALAAWLVPGWSVASFGAALLGALVVSVVSGLIGHLGKRPERHAPAQ
jgi:putative membrane protein